MSDVMRLIFDDESETRSNFRQQNNLHLYINEYL